MSDHFNLELNYYDKKQHEFVAFKLYVVRIGYHKCTIMFVFILIFMFILRNMLIVNNYIHLCINGTIIRIV